MKPNDKRLKNLKPFKKGQSGNPKGGQIHNEELKKIRRLASKEVSEIGTMLLEGNVNALGQLKSDKNTSVLKLWMASVAIKGISRGDPTALSIILDRVVGRVPQVIAGDPENPVALTLIDLLKSCEHEKKK